MATTGTTSFSPSLGDFVINAYARCGIRRTELLAQHMADARFETNMIMSRWSASGVNLWTVDLQEIPLVAGTSAYAVPTDTIFVLDAYISKTTGGTETDRIIFGMSRSDYASLANKAQRGTPTSYWYERLLSPVIHLWPVPTAADTLKFYRASQLQDAALSGGLSPEIPQRFFDCFGYELAYRLALLYAPDRALNLKMLADEAWKIVISSDTENVALKVTPTMSGYFR